MHHATGNAGVPPSILVAAATAVLAALVGLTAGSATAETGHPRCAGKRATITGTNHRDKIKAGPGNVVMAGAGNDIIRPKGHRGGRIVCGGPGNDKVTGSGRADVLVGGPGNDRLFGKHGNDRIVGDSYRPGAKATGPTGRDHIEAGYDDDFVVGDNFATGKAKGGDPDWIGGNSGTDFIIGGSASMYGNAASGGSDHVAGATGRDTVVGDSYAPRGTARGEGKDKATKANRAGGVNGGPGQDLLVGDNYTVRGMATGGGRDALHGSDGGDAGAHCATHACDDRMYGDNYAANCGRTMGSCQRISGGSFDLLNGDQGDDLLDGGPPDPDNARGKKRDRCGGGSGRDTAAQCEYIYPDVEIKIAG